MENHFQFQGVYFVDRAVVFDVSSGRIQKVDRNENDWLHFADSSDHVKRKNPIAVALVSRHNTILLLSQFLGCLQEYAYAQGIHNSFVSPTLSLLWLLLLLPDPMRNFRRP